MARRHYRVGYIDLYEPASKAEMNYLHEHMRPEELGEEAAAGATAEDREAAVAMLRRKVAIRHRGKLLGVGEMMDDANGNRIISLERTVHCLEVGHRFTWLRTFGDLVQWFIDTDNEQGHTGDFYTITPEDLPRALDLYGRYAGGVVISTIDVKGRNYWLLRIDGKRRAKGGE